MLSHVKFWRVVFLGRLPFKNHSTSAGAGRKGTELWSCLGDWSQLLIAFEASNASEIQMLSGPCELGEASALCGTAGRCRMINIT